MNHLKRFDMIRFHEYLEKTIFTTLSHKIKTLSIIDNQQPHTIQTFRNWRLNLHHFTDVIKLHNLLNSWKHIFRCVLFYFLKVGFAILPQFTSHITYVLYVPIRSPPLFSKNDSKSALFLIFSIFALLNGDLTFVQ